MENDAKEVEGFFAGRYERSSVVNGKPSYKMDDVAAIWYSTETTDWIIGKIDDLGSDYGGIAVKNIFVGLTDEKNAWEYVAGGEWKKAGKNDIIVKCSL